MPHAPLADDAPKDIHRGIHPPGSITRPRLRDTTARPHLRLAVSRSSSPALADPARQVAGLTLRLPDGRGAEFRVLAGKAGARITDARWLTLGLTAFGDTRPRRPLGQATTNRHQTLTIGPRGATTLTIDLTPATAHSVQMPTGAVHLTSYAPRTPQLGH